ncbi:hypothetical protein GCM10007140_31760 [Priestia taiwanensis]|uniref:Cytoplasmic protein n=2 Tax=Priestia taiwanensis TaxID=1347902 RepID=A0A917AWT6_9BACI|nr:hypothetical protein GCM10007140_31760 [Priestia taiwanensis]
MTTQTVRIEGTGKTKEQAIGNALGRIQKKVMSMQKGMVIRIEPLDIDVVEAKEMEYTERFLFFFLPRKRSNFHVVLDVEVSLVLLKVDDIHFQKNMQSNASILHNFRSNQIEK